MNTRNFAKGVGIGMVVGSAIGMTVSATNKKGRKQHKMGRTLKTVGDIVESIGSAFNM